MKRFVSILVATSLVLGLAGFVSGCKSDDEKFCEKLKELEPEAFEDCEDDALPEVKEMCGDKFGEAVSCLEGASDMDAAEDCIEKTCEKK